MDGSDWNHTLQYVVKLIDNISPDTVKCISAAAYTEPNSAQDDAVGLDYASLKK